ncbi:peptide ABC transporter substrate-binding protein [Pseudohongiella nitratireducens]|mgnify:FL=1|uniref:Peptide ABC transporter substrate-binding protein n=1 Tax=Pseudohongiella nitratireducens TaxID=1768907 RepID=A0A917GPL3_9GAMM|nr:peptide ABC transporter substrate-binding protein [Pseudohongiella nitratireducens]MDF1623229.1 peptide ABC transporter substrate-binding protein [Pseudohongiella nitratireducens]GGG53694.1 peptide ABC transporter substrate-binding protein [Pseudohongiella nitratireducens]
MQQEPNYRQSSAPIESEPAVEADKVPGDNSAQGQNLISAAGKQLLTFAIVAVVGLLVTMFLLDALAGLTSSQSTVSSSAIDYENNEITSHLRDEPPQMNSMRSTDSISGQVLNHVMEGLLRYDEHGDLVGGVAEQWALNGNVMTFHLRENARWSNGEAVTAHDFEFAWKNVLAPSTGSQYAFILYPILNAEAANNGEVPLDDVGVQAVDDFTLEVTLETPIAYFDRMVAFVTYMPANEAFYEQTNGRYGADADELLYNGPFMIESWVHGASMRLVKNPYYWDKERIRLDAINFAHMTSDPNTLLNLFKDEQIVMTNLGSQMLEEAMFQGWQIDRFMEGTVWYIEFNHRDGRLTTNKNLRMALTLAQDPGELVNRVIKLPGYLPGESLFPVWLQGKERPFRQEHPAPVYERNIELAREYLQKALDEMELEELPPLALLTGDSPNARMQAEYYQEVFQRNLGIDVVIDAQIFRQRLDKMTSGEFDLVMAGWGPDYNDPLTFADLFASWNLNNRGRYSNPELDAQIRIAQSSLDTGERMQAFAEIQRIIHEDVVIMPNYERGYVYVTHPELKGMLRRVIGAETDFTYAWIDGARDDRSGGDNDNQQGGE